MSPPATLDRNGKLFTLVQDQLRGASFAAIPFYDRQKVIGLLDGLNDMHESSRALIDPILMWLTSASVLQERFKLAG